MGEVNSRSLPALVFPCGHNSPDDYLFCDVCGVRRPSRCSSCQAINRGTANFCGKCGSELTGSSKLESDILASTPGPEDEAWGVPRQISSIESGTATSAPVGGNGRTSGLPAEPRPRNEPQFSEDAVALGRSGDAVPASENVERSAPAPPRQRSAVQSEQREPILQDDGELLLDHRLQQFLSKRRRRARVRWWGTLAAVTLTILVVAAVLFDAWLGRGRNGSNGEPGVQQLTPPTSEAPATSGASQPPAVTESPSTVEEAPAQPLGQSPLPTHVEPMPLKVEAESDRGATASRRSGAAVDSVQVMARSLIAKLGRERAEEAARTNASWYAPGSGTFLYWQRVANAIGTAKRGGELIP
jgi:Double zinc ribbon